MAAMSEPTIQVGRVASAGHRDTVAPDPHWRGLNE